ncbi:hypothetical protein [Propioniciclava flava]
MNHLAERPVTRTESWLQWADDHGVRCDDAGKSFDDVARDHHQTRDAYRELLTPEARGDGLSATHQAAANTAYARTLLIDAAIERRGGDLDLDVDPVQVRDPHGRIVPPRQSPEAMGGVGGRGADPVHSRRGTPAAARHTAHGQGVPAVTEPTLPLPDVPLIIEDLLAQAKQLADAGEPREAIEELLDQVAALREGRG